MVSKDTPHDIFINISVERLVDLLSDSAAAEAWIALLQCNYRLDEFP